MYLRCGPFQRPCKCAGAMRFASSNAACPGLPGSHWTPPLDNYSLCIAPAATRATANKTMMQNWANFAGHFDGHGGALVQFLARHPVKEAQGFGRSHWTPPSGKYFGQKLKLFMHTPFFFAFSLSTHRKRLLVDAKAPINKRGMTYQTKEKGLTG